MLGAGTFGGVAGVNLVRSSPERPRPESKKRDEELKSLPMSGHQRVIWSVDTDKPLAALTFDDGPDPDFTPRILSILKRHGVKATFMVMGYNAVKHPQLVRDIVEAGHEVGSHGWKHLNLAETTLAESRHEIEYGTRMIERRAGVPVRAFRPPYGRFGEAAVRLLARSRCDIVVWSIARGKLTWREPGQIADHIVGALGPGEIVCLHDGIGRGTFNRRAASAERLRQRRTVEVDALAQILKGARSEGLHFKTVSELVAGQRPDARA